MNQTYTMKEMNKEERPYEKCIQHGAASLSDAELLAVILRNGFQMACCIWHGTCGAENLPASFKPLSGENRLCRGSEHEEIVFGTLPQLSF